MTRYDEINGMILINLDADHQTILDYEACNIDAVATAAAVRTSDGSCHLL